MVKPAVRGARHKIKTSLYFTPFELLSSLPAECNCIFEIRIKQLYLRNAPFDLHGESLFGVNSSARDHFNFTRIAGKLKVELFQ